MHITLTGNLGSGKSTICKLLEKTYGYEIFSTGKVIRTIADEKGISVYEMNQLMCEDPQYDTMIDDATARIARENPDKNLLFDSRLAWHFVETSFRVFLSVDLDIAAERVFGDTKRGAVETYASVEEAKEQLRARAENEDKRYGELYGIRYFDFSNYDLVLDSSYCAPEVLAAVLMQEASLAKAGETKILMSPKRLGIHVAERKTENGFYPQGTAVVENVAGKYRITDGMEFVQTAAAQGYPFVCVTLR